MSVAFCVQVVGAVVVDEAVPPLSPHEAAKIDTTPNTPIKPSLIRFFTTFPPNYEADDFVPVVVQRPTTTETQSQFTANHQPLFPRRPPGDNPSA